MLCAWYVTWLIGHCAMFVQSKHGLVLGIVLCVSYGVAVDREISCIRTVQAQKRCGDGAVGVVQSMLDRYRAKQDFNIGQVGLQRVTTVVDMCTCADPPHLRWIIQLATKGNTIINTSRSNQSHRLLLRAASSSSSYYYYYFFDIVCPSLRTPREVPFYTVR